jgi:cell division protein FtsQ
LKKLILKLLIAFVLLPSVVAGSMYWLNAKGFFNVQQVQVVLADPEAQAQANFYQPLVEKLSAQMAPFKGQSLWSVKLSSVVEILNSQNWIAVHSISRSWPSTLQVTIKPHEVKLVYLGKNGKFTPIIEDGSFLDSVDSKQAPDVTLLDGEVFAQRKELRSKAVQVIKEIPAEGSFSKKTISEMRFDTRDGFSFMMMKTGVQVKIGEEQVALKSARIAQVVDYLDSREFEARVIDANLSKKVLVRLRKDP